MWWFGTFLDQLCPTIGNNVNDNVTISVRYINFIRMNSLTIWSFMVFWSRSIVLIFYKSISLLVTVFRIISQFTYKVYPYGADVAFWIGVILNKVQTLLLVLCRVRKYQITANRNRRQDFPTPESPISSSLKR